MKIAELARRYETFCPQKFTLEGDPVGLQIGSLDREITKALVTLDIREQTVAEAQRIGANFILAKHPVIFRPLGNLTDGDSQENIVLMLAASGISVYTSHTAIDVVAGGLNDRFAEMLQLTDIEPLVDEEKGLGRIGNIEKMPLSALTERVKKAFNLQHLRIVSYDHDLEQPVSRVAICGGSGGKFWPIAREKGADVYITGDIYYHSAHDLLSSGMTALDPGHYIEHEFIPLVADKLRALAPELEIIESKAATNPFYDI